MKKVWIIFLLGFCFSKIYAQKLPSIAFFDRQLDKDSALVCDSIISLFENKEVKILRDPSDEDGILTTRIKSDSLEISVTTEMGASVKSIFISFSKGKIPPGFVEISEKILTSLGYV